MHRVVFYKMWFLIVVSYMTGLVILQEVFVTNSSAIQVGFQQLQDLMWFTWPLLAPLAALIVSFTVSFKVNISHT